MSNFNIRINADANLQSTVKQFAALKAEIDAVNRAMEKSVILEGKVNPAGYAKMAQAAKINSRITRDAALSTGAFEVQQLRLNSAAEEYTKAIEKQKLTFKQWREEMKKGATVRKAAIKEQLALQNMVVQQMPGTVGGKKVVDVYIPNEVHSSLRNLRTELGFVSAELKAASTQMINWGKNTQWAGRQLMVGFTMPVALFGAAAATMTYKVDQQLTRIRKVYDTTANGVSGSSQEMSLAQAELARVTQASMNTAANAAKQYGQSITDTLAVQAELAATGKKGMELQQSTMQTMRIATLGELDQKTAIDMTVALQSAFKDTIKTSEDLSNAFNFMNSVENATSLSINDIAEAVPRAASAMAALGVNVQQMTVLLTAMRESGVDAAEGANALKSVTGSILKPSPTALKFVDKLTKGAVDIEKISRDTNGNIYDFIQELSQQLNGLGMGAYEVQQILLNLFGKYQFSRASALYKNLSEAFVDIAEKKPSKELNQAAKAIQVAGQSTEKWADVANGEIAAIQKSLAGRFKATIESVKVELAEMGKPFLEIGIEILGVIDKVLHAFNALPDSVKKFAAMGAIGAAVVGPLIMLTGLSANFAGNFLKFGASILGAATNFKLLNKESRAAQLAAKLAEEGYVSEGKAINMLTAEIKQLTLAAQEGALAQKQMMLAGNSAYVVAAKNARGGQAAITGTNQGVIPSRINVGKTQGRGKKRWNLNSLVAAPEGYVAPTQTAATSGVSKVINKEGMVLREAATNAAAVEESTKKTSKWLQAGAVSGGVMAAAMATTMATSNETANNLAQWAMVAAVAAPAFSGMAAGIKAIKWSEIAAAIGPKFTAGVGAAKKGFTNIAVNSALFAENLKAGNGAASGMARGAVKGIAGGLKSSLGAVLGMVSPVGWIGIGLAAAGASAFLIYKHIQSGKKEVQEMYDDAQGLAKILNFAPSEVEASLDKSGNSIVTMSTKVQEFRDAYKGVTEQIRNANDDQTKFNYAMAQGLKVIKSGGDAQQAKEAVELALRAGAKSAEEGDALVLKYKAQIDFSDAQKTVDTFIQVAQQAMEDSKKKHVGFWDSLIGGNNKEMKREEEAAKKAGKNIASAFVTATDNGLNTDDMVMNIQATLDKLDKEIKNSKPGVAGQPYERAVALRKAYVEAIAAAGNGEKKFTDKVNESTVALTLLKDLGFDVTDNTTAAAGEASVAADNFGEMADNVNDAVDAMEALGQVKWADEYKKAMSSTQDALANIASDNFTNKMNDAMDSYKKSQDARMDALKSREESEDSAFDARWDRRKKGMEAAYDARIKKIKDAAEAEQKAEEQRQKIFQAEITRLQRLAEMQNTNVDFNVAINSGNLDEAAKIRNDDMAKQAEWALSDSADASQSISDRKQDRLNKKSDKIEAAKDRASAALDAQEKAEKASLDRRQKAREKALQEEIDNNVAAQQEIWDDRKEKLDKAIEAFKNYVPKNEQDLKNHVARITKAYDDFNVATKGKFNVTSVDIGAMLTQNVKTSARSIKDDIAWQTIGGDIAEQMISGAFGMSLADFQTWITDGTIPKGAKFGGISNVQRENKMSDARPYHTGGIVGVDKGGWAGIRGHKDEVNTTLLKGEGVLNRKVMSQLGPDGFRQLNKGDFGTDKNPYGGAEIGAGLAGIMGAMMYRAMRATIANGIITGAQRAMGSKGGQSAGNFAMGKAGSYGGREFSASQLANAATIANVGKNMGMSTRDIEIGIMTAIAESGLVNVNYGDRDSLGLFQQRPSQGWGTPEQVTNPTYASKKFFSALRGVGNRGDMAPWLAAQAVQRSAFSDGSNYKKWWDAAKAIFGSGLSSKKGLSGGMVTGNAGGYVSGSGGWHKPSIPGRGWSNTHDYRNPIGSPLYAASDGTIIESRAITSGGSPGNGKYRTPYRSYGETILLRTASGDNLRYAHLSPGQRFVKAGQHVKGGSLIGKSGETGNAWGAHTHFDVNGNYNASGWMKSHGISLSKGAQNIRWDNTIANLHKGEAVLTEDINNQFKQGVKRFAEGPSSQYNLYMTVNGSNHNVDAIANKVMEAFRRAEARKPQSRSGK